MNSIILLVINSIISLQASQSRILITVAIFYNIIVLPCVSVKIVSSEKLSTCVL